MLDFLFDFDVFGLLFIFQLGVILLSDDRSLEEGVFYLDQFAFDKSDLVNCLLAHPFDEQVVFGAAVFPNRNKRAVEHFVVVGKLQHNRQVLTRQKTNRFFEVWVGNKLIPKH